MCFALCPSAQVRRIFHTHFEFEERGKVLAAHFITAGKSMYVAFCASHCRSSTVKAPQNRCSNGAGSAAAAAAVPLAVGGRDLGCSSYKTVICV